ncbi:DNA-binding protein [Phenylobacterium sp.]|jgi:excisionase family DNA binding protein|uniref:DNA-binding protein n=1 Tax=Phenylobacterium sp. TaxID=1871053 RepID=UPI002E33A9F3|nr:DNA-binding protein [Phenylobacterium sp.]HEX4712749.1 DNA-binding protein [Phenylobacterium sp.]
MPTNREPERIAYSVKAFCEATSFGKTKVHELLKSGRLKSVKVGGRRLILASETQRLLRGEL